MKKTYIITGMTCDSCKSTINQSLNKLQEIEAVEIDRAKGEAVILMAGAIDVSKLQNALPSKFHISEKVTDNFSEPENPSNIQIENDKSKLQQLKPLILILTYISVASIMINYKNWNSNEAMLDFMGLFYIVFSFFKMLDLKGFPESFRMYDPLAKRLPIYGWIYPFIETGLGIMLLMRYEVKIALIITLLVLGITTIGVTKTLLDKKSIKCACLGTVLKLPMTEATFIENFIMIVMAISMLMKNTFI
jgi:copper chaperone CopZ